MDPYTFQILFVSLIIIIFYWHISLQPFICHISITRVSIISMTSSNDSLFGLAANLQSMENNLNEFIFHCALRLSSMTDSRVSEDILPTKANVPTDQRSVVEYWIIHIMFTRFSSCPRRNWIILSRTNYLRIGVVCRVSNFKDRIISKRFELEGWNMCRGL